VEPPPLRPRLERRVKNTVCYGDPELLSVDWRHVAHVLATELRRWGHGDLHYGAVARDRGVIAALTVFDDAMAAQRRGITAGDLDVGGPYEDEIVRYDQGEPMAQDLHARVENDFRNHPPKNDHVAQVMDDATDQFVEMAHWIVNNVPPGREQSTALTKLEECSMHTKAGIARNQGGGA